MSPRKAITVGLVMLLGLLFWATESLAGTKLYQGSWIAESFGNDRVNIGTEESQYFEILGIPQGIKCHPAAPLCHISSTPYQFTTNLPTPTQTVWNPIGPLCRPLTAGEKPRPAKNGTKTTGGGTCAGPFTPQRPHTRNKVVTTSPVTAVPCNKTPPLYRNLAFFTAGGSPDNQTCEADQTVAHTPSCTNCKTTAYLGPGDTRRGIAMKGAPLTGSGYATTTGVAFKFPAAAATPGSKAGMRRTTVGSFIGEGPYLYSYTYAQLRNDAGTFGVGQGFFSVAAPTTTLTLGVNGPPASPVASIKVIRGTNRFGGVMKLLGNYRNKVCYYYGGGCGLGFGTWGYQDIGTPAYKDTKAPFNVTRSWTTSFLQVYYNTALSTFAKYDVIEQRFPWTTGTVTVNATGRGPNKTIERRRGFDNRTPTSGYGTVQLVSPLLTQWIGQFGAAAKFETGGIAVMQIKFIPEPGGVASLIAGISMLCVLRRFRR